MERKVGDHYLSSQIHYLNLELICKKESESERRMVGTIGATWPRPKRARNRGRSVLYLDFGGVRDLKV